MILINRNLLVVVDLTTVAMEEVAEVWEGMVEVVEAMEVEAATRTTNREVVEVLAEEAAQEDQLTTPAHSKIHL